MSSRTFIAILLSLLTTQGVATIAMAETPAVTTSPTSAVIPATATALAPTDAAKGQVVRFRQQAGSVGDRVVQSLNVDLGLTTKITQSGQTAHESSNRMRREQQRTIEVLEVVDGRTTRARASFQTSRRQTPESATPEELVTQPIEGKSYLMVRDGEKLIITDGAGATPPEEEIKLVTESLENVGKPNPLAALLVDRHVTVGQRILVPRDIVQPLLGFDGPMGSVHRFELTLLRVEPAPEANGSPLAIFQTTIQITPNDESPLTITLNGEMHVETETCRLTTVEMKGPVQLSSIERTAGGIFQFSAGGELTLAIRSNYGATIR